MDREVQERPGAAAVAPQGTAHDGSQVNGSLWRRRPEWNGGEGPRLLFDSLFGNPAAPGGLLGDALMFRGINLPRLFEGTWGWLTWPRWFQDLALLDDLVAGHAGSVIPLGEVDEVRGRAAQCVMARHPGVRIEFSCSLPVSRRLGALVYHGRLFRSLCMTRALLRVAWRGGAAAAGKPVDLAFFPWSPKIAPTILPVAEAAVSRGRMSACVSGWQASAPFDLEDRWEWDTPASARSPRILLEAWRAAGELRGRWAALRREGRLNPLAQWRGWDLRPLLLPFLETAVNHLYSVIANILAVEEWCKRRRIRGIVVPQDGGEAVRSLIAGARLAGVRSFSVQYGYSVDSPEISEPLEDLALLNGEFTRRCFLRRGASADKLAVVGSTAYDRVAQLRRDRASLRLEVARRYHLDPARPWLVVATWPYYAVYSRDTKEAELALIMEAAGRLPHVQVLCKLHPSDQEGGEMEASAARRFGVDARIIGDVAENESLVCSADAVVCNYTTFAIMAILARTPVLIVDLGSMQKAPNRAYVDEGVAECADTAASAEAALREILHAGRDAYWERRSDPLCRFIAERLHADDGQAAVRILDIVEAKLQDPYVGMS